MISFQTSTTAPTYEPQQQRWLPESIHLQGSVSINGAGVWTYTLNNDNAAVQALNVDDSLSDSFIATTADGTQQQVSITIHGFNDLAGLITTRELPIYSEGARRLPCNNSPSATWITANW